MNILGRLEKTHLKRWLKGLVFRQIGHLVMSSGHSYGAMLAGASQNLGSSPQTDPLMRPPGPLSPGPHFFQVDIVFCEVEHNCN